MVSNIQSPTFLGTIQDVNGITASVSMAEETLSGLAFIEGEGYRIGQIGSFVKIPIGYEELYAIITQVGATAVPEKLADQNPFGVRWMTIQLFGEGKRNANFERGISQFPTIGDEVHLVSLRDLKFIYGTGQEIKNVNVGHIAGADAVPAYIDVNKLLSRHSAILGSTGSGKSTTVAKLLQSISGPEKYPSARIVLIDIHGEYGNAFKGNSNVFTVSPNASKGESELRIPFWGLNYEELVNIFLGKSGAGSGQYLKDEILTRKQVIQAGQFKEKIKSENVTVDSPIPFSIHQLWHDIYRRAYSVHGEKGTGQSWEDGNSTELFQIDENEQPIIGDAFQVIPPKYEAQVSGSRFLSGSPWTKHKQLIDSIATKLRDPRLKFLFEPRHYTPNALGEVNRDLNYELSKWIGSEKPISIFDLSGIPSEIIETVIGAMLRIIYEALFWARELSEGGRERPILLVLEEAHKYLGGTVSNFASSIVKRIVKEGRKYGVGVSIISQRPSEIDSTILSQCGTIVGMRLTNDKDKGFVANALSDSSQGLINLLPILKTGEAIIVGDAVRLPIRAKIEPPIQDMRPDSVDPETVSLDGIGGWNHRNPRGDYSEILSVWRNKNPKMAVSIQRTLFPTGGVRSAGYNEEYSTLEIEFEGYRIYQYFEVSKTIFDGLMEAENKGDFIRENIDGKYKYRRA